MVDYFSGANKYLGGPRSLCTCPVYVYISSLMFRAILFARVIVRTTSENQVKVRQRAYRDPMPLKSVDIEPFILKKSDFRSKLDG